MATWLDNAFNFRIPFDDYNPIYETLDGVPISELSADDLARFEAHKSSVMIQIFAFLNLPSRMRKDGLSPLWDLIYLPEDANASRLRKGLGILFGILHAPLKLISVVASTVIHTLMLVTEILPLALTILCNEKLGEEYPTLTKFLTVIPRIWYTLGLIITSPMDSMRLQIKVRGVPSAIASGVLSALVILGGLALGGIPLLIWGGGILFSLGYADITNYSLYKDGINAINTVIAGIETANDLYQFYFGANNNPEPSYASVPAYAGNGSTASGFERLEVDTAAKPTPSVSPRADADKSSSEESVVDKKVEAATESKPTDETQKSPRPGFTPDTTTD